MGYGIFKYPTNRRYLTLSRSEKRRGVSDTYITCPPRLQENLEGLLDLLDGGTQSPTGGDLFSYLYTRLPGT